MNCVSLSVSGAVGSAQCSIWQWLSLCFVCAWLLLQLPPAGSATPAVPLPRWQLTPAAAAAAVSAGFNYLHAFCAFYQ